MRGRVRTIACGRWLALLSALATAACASTEPKTEANKVPTDYKPAILEHLRKDLEDPTNIRDAFISEPALRPVAGATRYVVCFRFNARERGRYAGNREMAAVFFDNQITQLVAGSSELCGGAAYQPFPELQRLCRSAKCQP
jgi:hypothetical protein